ncbi:hypothetical protein_gp185 [Bacillus phage vB_BceM_WH1]|nr:hypothetical protein_gp185 [Bacillus phage vB_BceM_WH1]
MIDKIKSLLGLDKPKGRVVTASSRAFTAEEEAKYAEMERVRVQVAEKEAAKLLDVLKRDLVSGETCYIYGMNKVVHWGQRRQTLAKAWLEDDGIKFGRFVPKLYTSEEEDVLLKNLYDMFYGHFIEYHFQFPNEVEDSLAALEAPRNLQLSLGSTSLWVENGRYYNQLSDAEPVEIHLKDFLEHLKLLELANPKWSIRGEKHDS